MKGAAKKRIPFTNKQLFSGFTSLYQNKPLKYLLYGTSIQQLVFSGFPIYIVIWTSLLLKDQAWLAALSNHFGRGDAVCGAFLVLYRKTGARKSSCACFNADFRPAFVSSRLD